MKYLYLLIILLFVFACQNEYIYDPNEKNVVEITPIPLLQIPPAPINVIKPPVNIPPKKPAIKDSYNAAYFPYNSDKINPVYKQNLVIIANYLKQNPDYNLSIYGHTDSKGTKKYNEKLSKKRAFAVKNYLLSLGIVTERLEVFGFAYTKPNRPGKSPADQAFNRRVVVRFIKK